MLFRGTILLLMAQVFSLISGYAINIFLARQLGPEGYGTFGVVYSLLMIMELFVVAGIPNALQRFIGEKPESAYSLHKYLFRRQLLYTIGIFSLVLITSPLFGKLLKEPEISRYLRIASFDLIVFSFYWYFNGFPIGQRKFLKYTVIVIAYSVFKFVFIFLFVTLGFSISGAFVGNVCGSTVGLIAGLLLLKVEKEHEIFSKKTINQFIISNILYSIGINLFFYIDLWFVKYFESGKVIGYYNAGSILGRIPYFFSIGFASVLLPNASLKIAKDDKKELRSIIKHALKMTLMVLLPLIVIVVKNSNQITTMIFGEDYFESAVLFRILFVGMTGLAFLIIMNTINIAKSGMVKCSILTSGLVLLDILLNYTLVPVHGAIGAALATMITMLVGALVSTVMMFSEFQVLIDVKSIVNILISCIIIYFIGNFFHPSTWFSLFYEGIVLTLIYLLFLSLRGEIDWRSILKG